VRVVKDADVRREELLDTALVLFLEQGYERTSVAQITSAVGVAKGTFYHYYETKSDLLEQLVERFAEEVLAEIERALSVSSGDAIDRLRTLMMTASQIKIGRKDETLTLSRSLLMPENRALFSQLAEGWIGRIRPFVRDIIDDGCAQGVFDVPDPAAMTEVLLSLWYDYGNRVSRVFFEVQDGSAHVDDVVRGMAVLQLAQERLLGVPSGGLDMNMVEGIRALLGET
jgi:AcrR family transcriptional regulator